MSRTGERRSGRVWIARVLGVLSLVTGRATGQVADAGARDGERNRDWTWALSGELRVRGERYANDRFGAGPAPDHDYVWLRAVPRLELRHRSGFSALTELIAAVEMGDEAGTDPVDEDRADLLQAFVELPVLRAPASSATLRGGRQVLAFGSERLVSARYGPNVPRAFDAADLVLERGEWRADLLYGRPVAVELGAFDDEADRSRALWGLYETRRARAESGFDLYYLGLEDESATFAQGTAREQRFGRAGAWDWNFELFPQTGSFGQGDVRAWSVASDTGLVLRGLPLAPRLGLKADVISGDDDPSDEDLGTFNPLFPRGQYFGEAGRIGRYNLVDVQPSPAIGAGDPWSLSLASLFCWRESTADGVYDNSGEVLRSGAGSDERFIGTQLDAVLVWTPAPFLEASLAWSVLVPGAFLESMGPDETLHFLGLELTLRF